jgi:alpha-beta hydrolase superfamily lysophospholipase
MRKPYIVVLAILFALMTLISCDTGPAPATTPLPTATPQPSPTPTIELIEVTSADVTFLPATGDAELRGTLYGQHRVGVILSHGIGSATSNRGRWESFAEYLAARGFMVLTYDAAGYGESQGFTGGMSALRSLQGAITLMREQGAEQIILMSELIGAPVTLDFAAANEGGDIIGVATLSAARQSRDQVVGISDEELATLTMPSLWIAASDTVYAQEVALMYEAAAGPDKELHIYDGDFRGTELFRAYGDDLEQRLLDFVIHAVDSAQ